MLIQKNIDDDFKDLMDPVAPEGKPVKANTAVACLLELKFVVRKHELSTLAANSSSEPPKKAKVELKSKVWNVCRA